MASLAVSSDALPAAATAVEDEEDSYDVSADMSKVETRTGSVEVYVVRHGQTVRSLHHMRCQPPAAACDQCACNPLLPPVMEHSASTARLEGH